MLPNVCIYGKLHTSSPVARGTAFGEAPASASIAYRWYVRIVVYTSQYISFLPISVGLAEIPSGFPAVRNLSRHSDQGPHSWVFQKHSVQRKLLVKVLLAQARQET